ncbi:unnamed protein product [Toxocara canis]|uniref:SMC_N domain-containing protein n=1 Tax=Toxocara canis TaxID=6265 RepID=A0A183UJ18_TOXCA|nr:unnamed protein product [Toxocara canis]
MRVAFTAKRCGDGIANDVILKVISILKVEPGGSAGDSFLDDSATEFGDPNGRNNLQDLKGLSGGERTYTVACFIVALWETVETPFRCMDEFDVFLDMNNRKMVLELLVNLATRRFPQRQFLFFTPQGLQDLSARDRVQVFEMRKENA